jgi:hypothetical protein
MPTSNACSAKPLHSRLTYPRHCIVIGESEDMPFKFLYVFVGPGQRVSCNLVTRLAGLSATGPPENDPDRHVVGR